jgi:hypothetical protein
VERLEIDSGRRVSSVNSTTCLQISKPLYRNLGIFSRLPQCVVWESSGRPDSAEIPALPIVGPPLGGGLARRLGDGV